MLSWPPTVRLFLCSGATDMRKGFDSLASLVESALTLDPLSGHLFVFRSRRGDRIKILWWDRDGYCLWYKRLERGSFRFPAASTANESKGVEVKAADLMMLLDGVDLGSVRRQRRYSRETVENPR
jgi:transposase